MKILYSLFASVAIVLVFASCEKQPMPAEESPDTKSEIAVDEALQAVLIEDILKTIDDYSFLGEGLLKSAEVISDDCPVVTVERIEEDQNWPRKITIDYGSECVHRGKTKSGQIVIYKTNKWRKAGSVREVEFVDYVVEGVQIEGTKRIENKGLVDEAPTFEITLSVVMTSEKKEGQEKVVKRSATKTQTWLSGYMDREVPNVYTVSGDVELSVELGELTKVVKKKLKEIEHHQDCKFPQSGKAVYEVSPFEGDPFSFTLKYGSKKDEGCNSIAVLEIEGEDISIDLAEKWRKNIK